MGVSCLALSRWQSSYERLTKHTEIVDAKKTYTCHPINNGSMIHFQSHPTVFLRSRHLRAGQRFTHKQVVRVVLVPIVRGRSVARHLVLLLVLDAGEAGGYNVEGLVPAVWGGDIGLGVLAPLVDTAGAEQVAGAEQGRGMDLRDFMCAAPDGAVAISGTEGMQGQVAHGEAGGRPGRWGRTAPRGGRRVC